MQIRNKRQDRRQRYALCINIKEIGKKNFKQAWQMTGQLLILSVPSCLNIYRNFFKKN
jgi:hypothetical protein